MEGAFSTITIDSPAEPSSSSTTASASGKQGILVKRGLGWLYRPLARRLFKLDSKKAILTYSSPFDEKDIRGAVKLQNRDVKAVKLSAVSTGLGGGQKYKQIYKFAFRASVRKLDLSDSVYVSSSTQRYLAYIYIYIL